MKKKRESVHRLLDEIQMGPGNKYIIVRQVPFGLGAQISTRIGALLLALALERKAVFPSLSDPPYTQTYEGMDSGIQAGLEERAGPAVMPVAEQQETFVTYSPQVTGLYDTEVDASLMSRIHDRPKTSNLHRLELEGLIFEWMRPTKVAAAYCSEARERLGVRDDTLGVHFRRGDKAVETAFVPASEINRQIAAMHRTWPFTSVFLASDSPRAREEIELPAGVRLIFDEQEQRYNNANHKMLMDSPELAEQETRVAYKNIDLLSSCGGVIGQDNAHFATLAARAIAARLGRTDTIALIDGRIAEKWSPLLATYFQAKTSARKLARRLLPHLTATQRMQRRRAAADR